MKLFTVLTHSASTKTTNPEGEIMLVTETRKKIEEAVILLGFDKVNASDHELLTHTRALIEIIHACKAQLAVAHDVLTERRFYIDNVVLQVNELTTQLSQATAPVLDPCGNIISGIITQ